MEPLTVPPTHADFNTHEWALQVTEAITSTVIECKLSKNIVLLGWSMAGRILKPISLNLKRRGLTIKLFVSLAATPAISCFRVPIPGRNETAAGYHSNVGLLDAFLPQMADQARLNGNKTIIDKATYCEEYIGHFPIGLAGWDSSRSIESGKMMENMLAAEDVTSDSFTDLPMISPRQACSISDMLSPIGRYGT
jgi:hypothetical protein